MGKNVKMISLAEITATAQYDNAERKDSCSCNCRAQRYLAIAFEGSINTRAGNDFPVDTHPSCQQIANLSSEAAAEGRVPFAACTIYHSWSKRKWHAEKNEAAEEDIKVSSCKEEVHKVQNVCCVLVCQNVWGVIYSHCEGSVGMWRWIKTIVSHLWMCFFPFFHEYINYSTYTQMKQKSIFISRKYWIFRLLSHFTKHLWREIQGYHILHFEALWVTWPQLLGNWQWKRILLYSVNELCVCTIVLSYTN